MDLECTHAQSAECSAPGPPDASNPPFLPASKKNQFIFRTSSESFFALPPLFYSPLDRIYCVDQESTASTIPCTGTGTRYTVTTDSEWTEIEQRRNHFEKLEAALVKLDLKKPNEDDVAHADQERINKINHCARACIFTCCIPLGY